MNRRNLFRYLIRTLSIVGSASIAACISRRNNSSSQMSTNHTNPSPFIDSDHASIRKAVETVAPSSLPLRERAVCIHDYVRDQVRFGWDPSFYNQTASEVLNCGVGFCNTKSTLFVAMLRAAGIPSQQHFVDINADIIAPFISPGTPYVDHSYAEVFLDGQWLYVDSFIVDKALFLAAKRKLDEKQIQLGFAIHVDGVCEWDGKSNAFSQFVSNGRLPDLTKNDYGVFDDVGAFYASGKGVNKLNALTRIAFGTFARSANKKIELLRSAT